MSKNAQVALAAIWAVWSLGWAFLWALTGIGLIVTFLCIPVAIIPFFFIRERPRIQHVDQRALERWKGSEADREHR